MLSYYLLSNSGDRKENEDSVGMALWDDGGIFALADGLGGHGAGALASQFAVEQILRVCPPPPGCNLLPTVLAALQDIHENLLRIQQTNGCQTSMKTTVAVAATLAGQLCIGHVGDSRVYIFGKKKILKRTLDHSVPQMLALAGEISEKNIRHHPDRNRLLRALGNGNDILIPDVTTCATEDVKALLLCSDGFWEYINERHMEIAFRRAVSPQDWLLCMERTILQNGQKYHMDNYSAIGVFLEN